MREEIVLAEEELINPNPQPEQFICQLLKFCMKRLQWHLLLLFIPISNRTTSFFGIKTRKQQNPPRFILKTSLNAFNSVGVIGPMRELTLLPQRLSILLNEVQTLKDKKYLRIWLDQQLLVA